MADHRLGDVFDLPWADVPETERQLVLDLIEGAAPDAYITGLRCILERRRHDIDGDPWSKILPSG